MSDSGTPTPSKTSEDRAQLVTLAKDELINDKWRVLFRIGEGGCGTIYKVISLSQSNRYGALKVEPPAESREDEILRMEVRIMRQLKNKPHVVQLFDCGRAPAYNFVVMQLLGPSLSDLRRNCPNQTFTVSTTLRLGRQCLAGLRALHTAGFVHRDIKPSNYAMGGGIGDGNDKRMVFILDFGLARECKTRTGAIRPMRASVPFRGTPRYCSSNVHSRREQGAHDDLWSLMYVLIEFLTGSLPWRTAPDQETTAQIKKTIRMKQLMKGCPRSLPRFCRALRPLVYGTDPPYDALDQLLAADLQTHHVTDEEPFDWEQGGRYYAYFASASSRLLDMDITDRSEQRCNTGRDEDTTDQTSP